MKEIIICKADPYTEKAEVKGVTICIDSNIQEFEKMEDAAAFYDKEAAVLADALFMSLPQGTCDRLLIELMRRKTSLYRGTTFS